MEVPNSIAIELDVQEKRPFEAWAVVELLGHRQIAGRVTEESIAGTNMLRVDVPELSAERPGHTKYFGGGSIYAIHPCSEELARQAAARLCANNSLLPVYVPALEEAREVLRQAAAARAAVPALPSGSTGPDYDEEDEFDDDDGY